ncbi:AAA family ATPase [Streptomyces profundus]|uniref:AAA family ATPase n=1 Tax=Streptomyces profundus TaxID=2867410 RepID=UPI001D166465|nr:AAA family ATPase [Streptomyces sp. MA3_2.13]UED87384.1 CHAT domain-containing protein [Streptomyces sp. MA3_2.13]
MAELHLHVDDLVATDQWRWVLTEPNGDGSGGRVVVSHRVRLDRERPEYEAFTDLHAYLRRHVAPDVQADREGEIIRAVGDWIAEEVLGPVAPALVAAAPAVVRVVVPPAARRLLFTPLELARVGGRPIALQDVSLVMEFDGGAAADRATRESDGPIRALALFSLPEGSRALHLRRERLTLTRLFAEARRAGRDVELHTLQYGVTRERLHEMLARPHGWDVVHLSGHGTPGELLLETDDGRPDRVQEADLVELLATARGVRLVSLSACWSATMAANEQRRLLDLPLVEAPRHGRGPAGRPVAATATELVDRLGCAVLAMRYPVEDGYAIALAERLYRSLLLDGQPLPRALAMALTGLHADASDGGSRPGALRAMAPALFGARAANLTLTPAHAPLPAPAGAAAPGGARLPDAPERFVGRVALLARASAALSPGGRRGGVLLHGMPGVGKTSCAWELASTHEHAFARVVWFEVPEPRADRVVDAGAVLADLALALEQAPAAPDLVQLLEEPDLFGAFIADVTQHLARSRLLLVLDRVDALVTPAGAWRDQRWATLLSALATPLGASRLIVTGRVVPAGLALAAEAVPLLSLDEVLLLVRELPRLARLVEGRVPGMSARAARRWGTGLLETARGHPKLLELVDAQASDPERLAGLLATAARTWAEVDGLTPDEADHPRVLRAWADGIVDELPPAHRDLFHFVCCLEEDDRTRPTIEHTWRSPRGRLDHPDETPVAALDEGLTALAAGGLLTVRRGADGDAHSYEVQSTVADQGRTRAGAAFRRRVDEQLSGYWMTVFKMAWQREGTDAQHARLAGPLIARAGLSASPYLIRLREWMAAEVLLEAVLRRDQARPTLARVLPVLRRLAALSAQSTQSASDDAGPPRSGALAQALGVLDRATAERQARAELARAVADGNDAAVASASSALAGLCVRTGHLDEALTHAEAAIAATRRAGHGPWTRLHSEAQRLRVMAEQGRSTEVLTAVDRLRGRMDALPKERLNGEAVEWWQVWEELHDTAQRAAVNGGAWQRAIEHGDAAHAAKRARGAPETDIAEARFPSYMPLLRLGRLPEALELLEACRAVFEEARDPLWLGEVFGALANVEDVRGHGEVAIARERDALRYAYRAGVPGVVVVGHVNLGTYLKVHARDAAGASAHHCAAALLAACTGSRTAESLHALAGDLVEFGSAARLPLDLAELSARVDEVPGVDLGRLLGRLVARPDDLDRTLTALVTEARQQAAQLGDSAALTEAVWGMVWEPLLAALVAADRGNSAARVKLRQRLTQLDALAPNFSPLAAVLRQLLDGARSPSVLADLSALDTPVATRALDALAGRVTVRVELWTAMHLGLPLGNVVAAAAGQTAMADAAGEALDDFRADPLLGAIVPPLEEILAGSRDEALATGLVHPMHRAAVAGVLHYLNTLRTARG